MKPGVDPDSGHTLVCDAPLRRVRSTLVRQVCQVAESVLLRLNIQRKGADVFVADRRPKSNLMKFQASERLMCGWKQKDFEMRFFALLLICGLAFFGCAAGREKARDAEISADLKMMRR